MEAIAATASTVMIPFQSNLVISSPVISNTRKIMMSRGVWIQWDSIYKTWSLDWTVDWTLDSTMDL